MVEAASAASGAPHRVAKLYYLAWGERLWTAYQRAFKKLVSLVDGVERQATPWPDWAITTVVDTRAWGAQVWRAVGAHASQVAASSALEGLAAAEREALWESLSFYRASAIPAAAGPRTLFFEGCLPRE